MKNNQLVVMKELKELDVYELEAEQIILVAANIIDKLNLKKLEDDIIAACLKLTGVGAPCFGADMEFIALDNQKRLDLTYMLLDNFQQIKKMISNLKRNKQQCRENEDLIFSLVLKTKEIIDTIVDYGNFIYEENEEGKLLLNK